ncbi:MAG: hypothetical protein Q9221_003291 [Calogaya cf. arnoldii]
MADSNVVPDAFSRDVRAVETIGRWLNGSERVALVTGVLVEEWDPSDHDTHPSKIFRKRKAHMTFQFKRIRSADFHSTAKGTSQVPHSEPDRLFKTPSLSKSSVMAPVISKNSTQASPLQPLPLKRGRSDERLISKVEQNEDQGAKLLPSSSERSSTTPFCAMVEKTIRTVSNSATNRFQTASGVISYQCQWDVLSFLQENFDSEKQISNALILVGRLSLDDPCAMTCSEYIYQTWPKGGPVMLQVMEGLFKSVKGTTDVHLLLSLADLVPLSGSTMCWPPLLAHTPVAVGFPIPQRKEGLGLELPPLLLARLAGIVMVVEFQGGLILKGLSTALIPVNYCDGGAAIQWHLLRTKSADGFQNDLEYKEGFLTFQDPTILFQKKAYLGWCKDTSILLGTSVFDYPAVSWSTSTPERSKVTVSGFSLGLASNGLGFFGPSATMNFTIAKSQRTRYMDIEQQLEDRLKLSVTKPALVYDTSTQRAWLVPVTCLLLQMMHLRYHQMASRVPDNSTSTMPYAKTTVEGGYEAYLILAGHLQPGSSSALGDQSAWRDNLARLYTGLDMALKTVSDFNKRPQPDESEVAGFELLDIVLAESPFRLSHRRVKKQAGG